jgi:hypothetical protein
MNGEQLAMMMGLHEVMVACQTNDILDLILESDSESRSFENDLDPTRRCGRNQSDEKRPSQRPQQSEIRDRNPSIPYGFHTK